MIRHKKAGFTVVETLIVLAVSSLLFLSVAGLINGQLNRFRARDAIFNVEANVRDVLNDVATGYYPETGVNYTCADAAGGVERGTNTNCVIAGKKIQFSADNILITPVVVSSTPTSFPSIGQLTPITSLSETKNYEWGITPTTTPTNYVGKTFYVLNRNYSSDRVANDSGGQSVGIYNDSLVAVTAANGKVCFVNGGQNSSITLGASGGLTVDAKIKDDTC